MKLFTISLAGTLFAAVSLAQIPLTTVPANQPPTPPQPSITTCGFAAASALNNTNWAFFDQGPSGNSPTISQIGTFTILPGGLVTGRRSTNASGAMIERQGEFWGSIDFGCLSTGILVGGTLQMGGGIGGQILTWSFPVTATLGPTGFIYNVTSVTTMNLRAYGALDPIGPTALSGTPPGSLSIATNSVNTQGGYGFGGRLFVTNGTANKIVGQVPCPVPADAALEAPNGYNNGFGTLLKFTAAGGRRGGGGTVTGNLVRTPTSGLVGQSLPNQAGDPGQMPSETGGYQVDYGCSGFSMNIPYIVNGVMIGGSFEGVFAAGDFSRFYILGMNVNGPALVFNKNP